MARYVCAFRGRRDGYQVPLALAEADLLDQFITDLYAGGVVRGFSAALPKLLREKLRLRFQPGIPDDRVACLWKTTLVEQLRHRMGLSHAATFAELDPAFSRAAAGQARRTRSNLFLYTPYAWEAFTASYNFTPRKVLFEYHPHPDLQRRILAEDVERFPHMRASYQEEAGVNLSSESYRRISDSWKHADLVLCASEFTRRSLIEAGAAPALCKVIPYGADTAENEVTGAGEPLPDQGFQALFVGSGMQRKGIHHLLKAWSNARLPRNSRLTLVCRSIDPGAETQAREMKSVRLIRGATTQGLKQLFESSALFVMPSLVEGFGLVFIEALGHGCPVLGTPNTCLPDLGDERDGIFLTGPGNIEQLTVRLEQLADALPNRPQIRDQARSCARRFTWSNFRRTLCHQLQDDSSQISTGLSLSPVRDRIASA